MFFSVGLWVFVGYCIVTAIQIFYHLYFFRRVAVYRVDREPTEATQPLSMVVCARDEAPRLARNLPGLLLQQTTLAHQVLVVDHYSTDETLFLLEELQKSFPELHVVSIRGDYGGVPGKKFPLSLGIKESAHAHLLLTDADCVPATEHWAQRMGAAFVENKEIVLGYGAYHRRPGLLNKVVRFETFHTAIQCFGYALAGTPYMGVGRNMAYTKELFFRHKGFAGIAHLPSGDDDLFVNRAAQPHNTAVVLHPEAFTLSEPPHTWRQWWRQKARHMSTGKHYRFRHKALLGLYTLSLFWLYPLLVLSILFFDWRFALIPLALRWLVQAFVWKGSMKRLGEEDLFRLFLLWDLWIPIYFILFTPALLRKPRATWR